MDLSNFMSLDKSQLRQAVSRLASAGNKRLKRLDKSDVSSISAMEVYESGGKFSTRNKDVDALRAEFMRVKTFLKSDTSTVKGAIQAEKRAIEAFKNIYDIDISEKEYKELLKIYYDTYNSDIEYQNQKMRYAVLYKTFGVDISQYDSDEKNNVKRIIDRLQDILQRNLSPGGMSYDGFASFFELE